MTKNINFNYYILLSIVTGFGTSFYLIINDVTLKMNFGAPILFYLIGFWIGMKLTSSNANIISYDLSFKNYIYVSITMVIGYLVSLIANLFIFVASFCSFIYLYDNVFKSNEGIYIFQKYNYLFCLIPGITYGILIKNKISLKMTDMKLNIYISFIMVFIMGFYLGQLFK